MLLEELGSLQAVFDSLLEVSSIAILVCRATTASCSDEGLSKLDLLLGELGSLRVALDSAFFLVMQGVLSMASAIRGFSAGWFSASWFMSTALVSRPTILAAAAEL